MTRLPRKTLALAISSVLSVNAAAFTIYDNDPPAGDTSPSASLNYAAEIVVSNRLLPLPVLVVDVGAEISKSDYFFPRFDLSNAKFEYSDAAPYNVVPTGSVEPDANASTPGVGVAGNESPGAGDGQSYIFYSLQNGTTAAILTNDSQVQLQDAITPANAGGMKVTTKAPVSVTYRLYQSSSGANNATSAAQLGQTRTAEVLNFSKSAIDFSTTPDGGGLKIDVGDASKTMIGAAGGGEKTISLGTVKILTADKVYSVDGNQFAATEVTLKAAADTGTAVVGSGTKLVVTGDFTASMDSSKGGDVFLAPNANCDEKITKLNTVDVTTLIEAEQTSFTIGDATTVAVINTVDFADPPVAGGSDGGSLGGTMVVCMKVDGETAMNGGQYSATYVPVTADSSRYTVSNKQGNLYKLVRNGAILQTPFFNLVPGYVPRFYLTNTGPAEAAFTIQLISDADASAPLVAGTVTSGTIPKGGAVLLKADEIAASGQRGSAIFQVLGLDENINGLFQFRNQKTGNFDSIVMPHRAYIYGPPKE